MGVPAEGREDDQEVGRAEGTAEGVAAEGRDLVRDDLAGTAVRTTALDKTPRSTGCSTDRATDRAIGRETMHPTGHATRRSMARSARIFFTRARSLCSETPVGATGTPSIVDSSIGMRYVIKRAHLRPTHGSSVSARTLVGGTHSCAPILVGANHDHTGSTDLDRHARAPSGPSPRPLSALV